MAVVMTLALLLACGPAAPEPTEPTEPVPLPTSEPAPAVEAPPSKAHLTPNPVEESMPQYGGTLKYGFYIPRSFDSHMKVGYGPSAIMPAFNQLVMYDIDYKECVPENIIGDLAESWETSEDGKAITFKLHQGVKWHDGMPFTADDVTFSLEKMNDVERSGIKDWFPAYESVEKIDEYTVTVHLKYPSAGFLLALAQGECQIQALHMAGTDDQSADFIMGTGPFILEDYMVRVHIKYQKNPDYWKKDKYGNQMPYLDALVYHQTANNDAIIGRRLDMKSTVGGAGSLATYQALSEGAPELLWQRRDRFSGYPIFINTSHPPLDDIRVRRAMGLVLNEEELIIGFSGDPRFGMPGVGILHPDWGLPKGEIAELMGWDKPYEERVVEAQKLMAEAGYPDGFKLDMMAAGSMASGAGGALAASGETLVFAEALRTQLKIDAVVPPSGGQTELQKRLDEGGYDTYTHMLSVPDISLLAIYFGTGGYDNWSKYSNPELDKMLADLDRVVDPDERREAIWAIERVLLTDLPVLPTGCFPPTFCPYYPYVKNLRWNGISYSYISRLEDVWFDKDIYQQIHGKLPD
jgi:peptide/nickel transport system substrate-binding protein